MDSDPKSPGPAKPSGGVKLEIKIDEETAQGRYANMAVVNFTETEFVIDFLFVQPPAPGAKVGLAKVFNRVLSNPTHTKRFLTALAEAVRKYEQRFGAIDVSPKGGAAPPHSPTPSGGGVLH